MMMMTMSNQPQPQPQPQPHKRTHMRLPLLLVLLLAVDARPVPSSSWIKGFASPATSTTTSSSSATTPHSHRNMLRRHLQRDDDDWRDDDDDDDDRNNNKNDKNERDAIPDDVYHCRDPEQVWDAFKRDKTVECDWDTHEWMIDELHEDVIPRHCVEADWEFTGVEDLEEEWEEPCYLWTITYGELAPSVMPSVSPTSEPTTTPTPEPSTSEPTFSPTFTPTVAPTVEETSALTKAADPDEDENDGDDDFVDDELIEEDLVEEGLVAPTQVTMGGPKIYEISTMVMTYMMDPPSPPVVQQVTLGTPTISSRHYQAGNGESRRLRSGSTSHRRVEESPPTMDRTVLVNVTANHVEQDLQRQLAFWLEQQFLSDEQLEASFVPGQPILQISADLTMTSVRSFLLDNQTFVATEAISGFVSVQGPSALRASAYPESLEPQLEAAFVGTSLDKYQDDLQASDDPVLQRTAYIDVGLPLDLLSGSNSNAAAETEPTPPTETNSSPALNSNSVNTSGAPPAAAVNQEDSNVWTVAGVDFSLTTLAIVAACIAGFSILLLLCVCLKLRAIRKEHMREADAAQKISSKTTSSTDEDNGSKRKSKSSKRAINQSVSSELIDAEDPNNNRYYQRYVAEEDDQRSLATSTYSYIDSNLHRGGDVSLAPSYMYGYGNNDDDASLQSKTMWSLIDGITNEENYNYDKTASPSPKRRPGAANDKDQVVMQTPETALDIMKSPSNMMINTNSKNGGYITDDDDMTMTSLGVGTYPENMARSHSNTTPSNASLAATPTSQQQQQTSPPPPVSEPDTEATTPSSQDDGEHNPFAGEIEDTKLAARLGVSARKKATAKSTTRTSKALNQLAACVKSRDDDDDLENSEDYSANTSKNISQSRLAGDSTLKDVNQRLQQMGDSTLNSKNSSLLPDKLFNDDTLESGAGISIGNASVIDTSQLVKDENGNYIIDTMSSF